MMGAMRTKTHALALPAAALLALGLAACGDQVPVDTAETDSSSSTSQESTGTDDTNTTASDEEVDTTTEDTSALDLKVGDCFNDEGTSGTSVTSVPTIDCNAPHTYEVYYEEDLTTSSAPTGTEVDALGTEICEPAFETFVGIDYASSVYMYSYLYPSADTWATGDRTVTCVISSTDGSQLTGSVEGTAM
ncbi:Uncharacterised protein [Actinomyces howellii]|uniref:Septum formation-related domain-containing protein n=2 Tax=Actinomyces howellii TaxID=52771 RepID=A0A3S4V5G6_9ACTO|nr:Uncharacterised protein [Actinomyces howellii]